MERGRLWSALLALALLAATSRAEPLEIDILTEWNGQPVEHVPVSLTLDSTSDDVLQLVVQAPFFDDPAPPAPDNSSFIGLWDYEVVELFLLNDADQYLQVELAPRGQYFALLFDGERNYKRFSLPLTVSSVISGDGEPSWTATAEIPTDYLPYKVTRVNAYSTHGLSGERHYEAYSPAPSTATEPDYHNLEHFAPIDLDVVIPGLSSRPMSELWRDAVSGLIRYSIDTFWNGAPIDHAPVVVTVGGNENEVIFSVTAPYFDDPAPDALPGEPFNGLWNYEVVEAFFLNDENQYLEVEVGPHGQHLDLLLWTKNDTYNQMRHSLPMTYTSMIDADRATWTGTATIPVEYLPPKVTRFNAYCKHIPGEGRHEESLYPQDPTDEVSDFHALKYFRPIDLNSVVPGQSERPMSQLWQDTIQGIFRYEIDTEWNSVQISHPPTIFTLEGFEAGVELNVTAPFYNDPAPGGTPGEPFYGLWDYEVVEMFFLNDNEEYLEVELGPWGEHLLLMLKGQRNAIKHSLPLDYVVTARENGSAPLPGMWQASALIPPSYFPPNVTRVNAYAIHGTGDDKHYEALYPAPLDDPRYPQPDFHRLELFQKMDFEFLVVDNSQYSDLWLEAIANMTTPAPVLDDIVTGGAEADLIPDEFTRSSVPKVKVETNELFSIDPTTVASEEAVTSTSAPAVIEDTVTEPIVEERDSSSTQEPVLVDDVLVDAAPAEYVSLGVAPVDATPVDATPVDEVSSDAIPVLGVQFGVVQADDVSIDDVYYDATPVDDEKIDGATVDDGTVDATPADEPVDNLSVDAIPVKDAPVDDASIDDPSSSATAKESGQSDPEEAYESTTIDGSLITNPDLEVTTILPRTDEEEILTTVIPEATTTEAVREIDVPQPELVKEARRQDIEKPIGNLFRPIPVRASPRTPHPAKLDENSEVITPFVAPNAPFSNPAFGVVQQPHFSRQPLFPPPSFFNPQSAFGRQPYPFSHTTPPNPSQTAFINGRPVAIQGQTQFPLPPQIKLKTQAPSTPTLFLPPQPHLDHLLHHHVQQNQAFQQVPVQTLSTTPSQQVDLSQETNEILPDRIQDPNIPASAPAVLVSQVAGLPASSIQHSVPQAQQVIQVEQPQVQSHVIEAQEDSLPMVQEGPIEVPVQPLIGSQTPLIQPQRPVRPIVGQQVPVQPLLPVQPIIEPEQPIQAAQPETPLQSVVESPSIEPQQSIIEQPVAPVIPVRRPAPSLPLVPLPKQPARPPQPSPAPTHQSVDRPSTVPSSAIPYSHSHPPRFVCVTQGLFSDPHRCPIFYECALEDNVLKGYTWRCPRGKYFNEATLNCVTGYC